MGFKLTGRVGFVARFKPVHKSHKRILELMCEQADHVSIGFGSSNIYDVRNPFTVEESKDMVDLVLQNFSNYSFIELPDLHNGPKWTKLALETYNDLDYFVTGNDYVKSLLENHYAIVHPTKFLPKIDHNKITATLVRYKIAICDGWNELVPDEVSRYIETNKLDQRLRQEFGLQTIASSLDKIMGARNDSW
jgi:nicotinamide mononucleotide adenylyltransferase